MMAATPANPYNSATAPLNGRAVSNYIRRHPNRRRPTHISNATGRPVAHSNGSGSHGSGSHGAGSGAAANDPYAGLNLNYDSPMSVPDIKKYVESAIKLKYGAQEKSLGRTEKAIPGWYDQYRATLAKSGSGTVGSMNAAAGSLVQPGGNVAAAAPVDPNATVTSGSVQADNAGFANMLKTMAANETGRYGELGQISQGDQIQKQSKVRDALTQLQSDKGTFRVTTLRDVLDGERNYGLEKAAFNLNNQKTQAEIMLDAGINPVTGEPVKTPWKDRDMDHDGIPNGVDPRPKSRNNHPASPGSAPTATETWDNSDADGDGIPNSRDPDAKPPASSPTLTPAEKRARAKQASGVMDHLDSAVSIGRQIMARYPNLRGARLRDAIGAAMLNGEYGHQRIDPLTGKPVPGTYSGKPLDVVYASSALDYLLTKDHHISKRNRLKLRKHGARKIDMKPYRPHTTQSTQDYNHAVNNGPGSDAAQR